MLFRSIMQLQQQENQQLLKTVPEQQPHLHKQFQQQTLPIRSAVRPIYEPGMCARRLTQYMYQQQHRPEVMLFFPLLFLLYFFCQCLEFH